MALNLFGRKKKNTNEVVDIATADIVPNRFQPRKVFQEESIKELAATIKNHGLLQPIVVREYEHGHYEIIAGERRFRAVTTQLGWQKVPAIITKMADDESAAMAIVENLQRAQLTPVEEARAYDELMQANSMTQATLARQIGKSQSFVANKLRLLKLSDAAQTAIMNGAITERHGRELLKLDPAQQQEALTQIAQNNLTVKETAEVVQEILHPDDTPEAVEEASANEAIAQRVTAELADEQTPAPAKKKAAKPRKRRPALTHDTRIAVNTIKHSLQMVKDSGMELKSHEEDDGDVYRIVIEIPKNK
ncbi:ParB/RepB/Spo0J family partition protein [Lacticaseibacillus zhaodongensis]|uniref:ParB/RepB/Spo0J family partition protein n=1 Tax=Lacticaseibacillus zhaodongensis TaxID=2668065 RepID=UPI0012D34E80|nr:ParB/RepB/Spo0J family partition protein [Lacticaseibacillus zhaodongensis]